MIFQKYQDSYERFPKGKVDTRLNTNNRNNFLQVLNLLIGEGVIMWGNADDRDRKSEPYFSITDYGKKVLEAVEGEIVPHDPENYITNLKKRIEGLDSLVLPYLQECLQCHLRGNYLASSVMLGVASEATFDLLYNWMLEKDNVTNPELKKRLEKFQNKNDLEGKFDLVYRELDKIKTTFDLEIREIMQTNLNGIFTLIRMQRNDSGHPTGKTVSKDQMLVYLQMFPSYCETVYRILNYLKNSHQKLL